MDKIDELKKLKDLLDNEFISQEEFNSLKNEILGIDKSNQQIVESDLAPKVSEPLKKDLESNDNKESSSTKKEETEKRALEKKEKIEKVEVSENILKCKKCETEISEYLDRSNKGLCLECKEKGIQIPKLAYLSLLLLVPLFWWIFKDSSADEQPLKEQIEQTPVNNRLLTIKGNDIWVRDTPKTGEVVLKLNDNNRVSVSDSCCYESIKGNASYWYKIDFKGKNGWLFGSQTKEFSNGSTRKPSITRPKRLYSALFSDKSLVMFHGFGTEPFWDLYITKNEILYMKNREPFSYRLLTPFDGNKKEQTIKFQDRGGEIFEVVIIKQPAGDGMSEKTYPYSVMSINQNLQFNGAGE